MSDRKPRFSALIGETFKDGERVCYLKEIMQYPNGKSMSNLYTMHYTDDDSERQLTSKMFSALEGPFGAYAKYAPIEEPKPALTKMAIWQAFMRAYPRVKCPEGAFLEIMQEVTNELLAIECE